MSSEIVEELGRIPMSPFLTATLTRAADLATSRSHAEVTLEHLLLALAEDPEASVVLKSSHIDIARLSNDVMGLLGRIEARLRPESGQRVALSAELRRILEAAAAAAQQGRRREINGAIVLAAIVGDGKSAAAHLLRAQGLTFEEAIRALKQASSEAAKSAGQGAAPPRPASTEDVLAAARERVQSRSATTSDAARLAQASGMRRPMGVGAGEPSPLPADTGDAPFSVEGPLRTKPQRRAVATPSETEEVRAPATPSPPASPAPGTAEPRQPRWAPPSEPTPAAVPAPSSRVPPPIPPPIPPVPPALQKVSPGHRPPPQAPAGMLGIAGGPARQPQPPMASDPRWARSGPIIEGGQLVENIPRRMRVEVPVQVEARLARADVKALAEGLQGGGAAYSHDVMVTRAMSVNLRAPEGGFYIEKLSPETQWLENMLDPSGDNFASWRWTVTPRSRGSKRLQLLISARTTAGDGVTAETAMAPQFVDVRVRINYARTARRWAAWTAAAIVGGLLARFGEGAFALGRELVGRFMSG